MHAGLTRARGLEKIHTGHITREDARDTEERMAGRRLLPPRHATLDTGMAPRARGALYMPQESPRRDDITAIIVVTAHAIAQP